MEEKGYVLGTVYMGWVGDRYMEFETEGAYLEYVRESD